MTERKHDGTPADVEENPAPMVVIMINENGADVYVDGRRTETRDLTVRAVTKVFRWFDDFAREVRP